MNPRPYMNRECVHCRFPCQGGEKLHKAKYGMACGRMSCPCMEFEPVKPHSVMEVLNRGLSEGRKKRPFEVRL